MLLVMNNILRGAFRRKDISEFAKEDCLSEDSHLKKNLTLFDLLCVGIGGTVGSGVFLLSGFIAKEYAGPEVVFSWLIAGIACCFSAVAYAELACRIPSSGSSYSFVYVTLGEWPAYIAAWCLSLECGLSSSAVARSWGVKLQTYLTSAPVEDKGVNIFGGLLETFTVAIFYCGISVGQLTVNIFTSAKVVLILFMIVVGFSLWVPGLAIAPAPSGVMGILRGATPCFFGFVGYDEVCCLSSEVKDPKRTVPLAVFGTIFSVTVFYCLASLALVGMHDYRTLDEHSGFAGAFRDRKFGWAADITAWGELLTLPVVVFVSFLAQPRIQYAMAMDGLVPKAFATLDSNGNLSRGVLLSGIPCILLTFFVPFTSLEELISAGVLLCFCLTDAALILIRLQDSEREKDSLKNISYEDSTTSVNSKYWSRQELCKWLLVLFTTISLLLTGLLVRVDWETETAESRRIGLIASAVFSALGLVAIGWKVNDLLHQAKREVQEIIVNNKNAISSFSVEKELFRAPFVPFVPLAGLTVNAGLLMQVSDTGLLLLLLYVGIASICYFLYSFRMSFQSNAVSSNIGDPISLAPDSPINIGSTRYSLYGNPGSNDTTVEMVHSPIPAVVTNFGDNSRARFCNSYESVAIEDEGDSDYVNSGEVRVCRIPKDGYNGL